MKTLILDTPAEIERYRLVALKSGLRLEIAGMKKRGKSCFSILKGMGYKGTKAEILAKLTEELAG